MAKALLQSSKLKVSFDNGFDEKGNVALKSKTFNNVRTDSTADECQQVVDAIGTLSSKAVLDVLKIDSLKVEA